MMKFFVKPNPTENLAGFIYFLLQLLVVPGLIMSANLLAGSPLSEGMVNMVFFGVNFLAVLLIFRNFLFENFQTAADTPWLVLRTAGIGYLINTAGNVVFSLLVLPFFPDFANINDAAIMAMVQENFGLMTLGTVILVPVAEECFYRGLIFRNLYDRSPVLGYLLSMVFFSMIHVAGYVLLADLTTLVLCFLQYLPAAFALAWCYRQSGSIFAPILLHMAINQVGMILMR